MKISILTLFPEFFSPVLDSSILGRAQKKNLLSIHLINIRDYTTDKHKTVDDTQYGGGTGMIMRIDVIYNAIQAAKSSDTEFTKTKTVYLDPAGPLYTQKTAQRYAQLDHLIMVCGHYEGVDARITHFIDERISIGTYILTGGEIPAMVIADSVARLLPDVLPTEATQNESFSHGNEIEEPQYTRPDNFKGYTVPKILLSGNHDAIRKWRKEKKGTYSSS